MLDIKLLRNHFDEVEKSLATRNEDFDLSKFKELDDRRRALLGEMESKKAEQKKVSKQIPMKKKAGEDVTEILAEMKVLSEDVKNLNTQVSEVEAELNAWMLTIPNIPNPSVPEGNSDEDNVEIRKFGEPTKFDFEPKAHWDLGKDLGILDPETAAKISGTRFTVYRDLGARLERAITNFFLDTHTSKHGYTEVFPPFMVSRESMTGTGQLPKFEEDAFKVAGTDYFLVPTAEVPVTNMYSDMILDGKNPDEVQKEIEKQRQDVAVQLDSLAKSFIQTNYENVLGPEIFIIMCYGMPYPVLTPVMEEIIDNAPASFKENPMIKEFISIARTNMDKLQAAQ